MAQVNLKIIGLSGTNGSGKDTIGQILADKHGYLFISGTELLRDEAKRRGLPVDRENLRDISAQWRRELGLGVLIDKVVAEYETVKDKYKGLVTASLRNPGEADQVHELRGTVIWVDADPKVRYSRIQANKDHRGRAGEDNKTFEEFLTEEKAEMSQTGDAATLNMLGVKDKADLILNNNFANLDKLAIYITKQLGL